MLRPPLRTACRYAVGLFIAAMIMQTWLVMGLIVPVVVSGSSMAPTLQPGSRLIVDRAAFVVRRPQRWDVVVFRCPDRADEFCVKRVVGLPGDSVELIAGELFVNGQRVVKQVSRLPFPADLAGEAPAPRTWRLGPAEYFVVGDNAAISDDSRSWVPNGALDAKLLIGKPFGVR
ncbi:MAG: signal peptidase I [Pirellulales bacterium]